MSCEFLGPFRNGGIGTAYTKLGEALNEAGHEVTFLYTNGRYTLTEPIEHWIEFYGRRGIRLIPMPESPVRLSSISGYLSYSYRVYLWLRDHDRFDVVHFPECGAQGYHSVLAKRQGLILKDAITIVGLHASTRWVRDASERVACTGKDLEDDHVERRSAELADIVWSPGQYMLGWARQHGWNLGRRCHVQPYVVPTPQVSYRGSAHNSPVQELVFFGRQEVRKGLFLFLNALDRLVATGRIQPSNDLSVTILGKSTVINGEDSEQIIRARSQRWPFPTQVLTDRDYDQAIEYLRGEGRLVVIPSIDENYPNTVLECLAFQVPFLASRVGSIPEQIHPDDIGRVCFDPDPRRLAERLEVVLREGHSPARLSFDPEQNRHAWVRWHERLIEERLEGAERNPPRNGRSGLTAPMVSVCIAHHRRTDLLRQALDSIVAQDESPLEVIVVDSGSLGAEVQLELDAVVRDYDFPSRGWRLIRQTRRSLGAARNRAALEARGDYLLFMDEDNVAKPHEIATLTRVARHTSADVLSCSMDVFEGDDAPGDSTVPGLRWLSSGANHPLSGLYNSFKGASAMIKRAAFVAAGGFREDCGVERQESELLSRLLLQGSRLEVVPEPLYWHRATPGATFPATAIHRDYLQSLHPYLEQIPEPYHSLIETCVGQSLADHGLLGNGGNLLHPGRATATASGWPLRYRIVDGLNARLGKFSYLHRAGKRSIHGLLRLRRRLLDALMIRTGAA